MGFIGHSTLTDEQLKEGLQAELVVMYSETKKKQLEHFEPISALRDGEKCTISC